MIEFPKSIKIKLSSDEKSFRINPAFAHLQDDDIVEEKKTKIPVIPEIKKNKSLVESDRIYLRLAILTEKKEFLQPAFNVISFMERESLIFDFSFDCQLDPKVYTMQFHPNFVKEIELLKQQYRSQGKEIFIHFIQAPTYQDLLYRLCYFSRKGEMSPYTLGLVLVDGELSGQFPTKEDHLADYVELRKNLDELEINHVVNDLFFVVFGNGSPLNEEPVFGYHTHRLASDHWEFNSELLRTLQSWIGFFL